MAQSSSLSATKGRALEKIDDAASQARRLILTHGFGQDLVYQIKQAQAESYLSLRAMIPTTSVPAYVAAEAAAWGVSATAAAQAVVNAAGAFHQGAGPAIEQARMSGKISVRAATRVEDVAVALAAAVSAISAIS